MKFRGKTTATVIGAAVLLVGVGAGGAEAARLVTSHDIKNGAVHKVDLSAGVKAQLAKHGQDGVDGKNGKDGVSNLVAGSGYNTTWTGDGGASLQTVRGECPAGQYALGGGFSTWGGDKDLGGDNKNIQITVSAPYFEGEYIPVDDAGNFRPTEWVVKGYNNGDKEQIVRAWVTCASVTD
jgi:hypothetical protein